MRQHGHAGSAWAVIRRRDRAAQNGMQAHDFKEMTVHHSRPYLARLAESNHQEPDGGKLAKRGNGLHAPAQLLDLGHRERRVLDISARRALANVNQPVLVAVDERP